MQKFSNSIILVKREKSDVKRKKIISILFIFNLILIGKTSSAPERQKADTDTLSKAQQAYMYIRGIERDEKQGFHPIQLLCKTVLYIPGHPWSAVPCTSGV